MSKRTVSGIVLTLLLTGTLSLAFNIKPVRASGTIYIRADGSIEGTTYITTSDMITYTFTAYINDSIVIERDGITLDGNGFTLQGTGHGAGISLIGRENVTIQNVHIQNFSRGVDLDFFSDSNRIIGNNITNNQGGIELICSRNCTISGNNITNNISGINLYDSSNCTISGNNVTGNNERGITLSNSIYNTLVDNTMANNIFNFCVYGSSVISFMNDVDASNTVDGKPVYYWIDKQDMVVPLDAGYVALINCTRITVQNLNLTNNLQGILLVDTSNSTLNKNHMANNYYGLLFGWSSNNTLSGNSITNNKYGIDTGHISHNSLSENTITNNWFGIRFYNASDNSFFHNNFGNDHQISITISTNVWDDGYPSGGNYWSDYTGVDERSGVSQDQLGGDGMGDTPYIIDGSNRDRYPLMKPYGIPHDIGITGTTSKTVVGEGYSTNITIRIMNYGMNTETFNLTAYINTTLIATFTNITLPSRNSTTITFTWNTTGFTKGNYTIWANATSVPGETDTSDNTSINATVLVGVPCDITGPTPQVPDGICNMRDIGEICGKFGTTPSSPDWDSNCDVTGPTPTLPDGTVNMRDIGEACNNFMKT